MSAMNVRCHIANIDSRRQCRCRPMFNVDPNMLMPLVLGAAHHDEDMNDLVYCSSFVPRFWTPRSREPQPGISIYQLKNYTVPGPSPYVLS